MAPLNIDNIENYRKHWETDAQWEMRKDFILTYHDEFDEDRLLCLAQVYVNIEELHNEYDQKLMNEVKAMALKMNLTKKVHR